MIDGINKARTTSSNTSYRDQMADKLTDSLKDETEETEGTESTGQVWNAVFTDKKENSVSVDDFLSLMVAQLRNQDFMNPVDDTQYVTQLAQFSTMQQMQEMATYMKTNYVMSLVGKNVTAAKFTVGGDLQKEVGQVTKISLVNNEYLVYVNGKSFSLEQIMELNSSNSSTSTEKDQQSQRDYLMSLIGRNVTVKQRDEDGKVDGSVTGDVEKVSIEDDKYKLSIGGNWYLLEDVLQVGAAEGEKPEESKSI